MASEKTAICGGRVGMRWCCCAPRLALLLNPYGWALHVHVFRYLRDTELLSRVAEFQSFNFHSDGAGRCWLCCW
ncbi:MAG: hypothetical protein IPP47_21490 [Bryobacterales bacterium]|nr:hypothetical protein [Bryobacterales bacterium]